MCCTWLAENTRCKKIGKKSPSAHHRTILSGYIFATKAHIDNRKILLNSNIFSICPHNMANFGPLMAEIGLGVWGTQQISTGFASWLRYCSDVTHRRATKLCTMLDRLLADALYIHFRGLLPTDGILPGARFTLGSSVAFYYTVFQKKLDHQTHGGNFVKS